MDLKAWPILYHDILRVKDKKHHLGVCSLWTQRDVVEEILEDVAYNVIGNLYSGQGINAMIRNVMAKLAAETHEPFAKKPRLFKKSEPKAEVLPSEQTGFSVRGAKVAHAWLK